MILLHNYTKSHDPQTGYNPICGFSIKSELGSKPTLLNASLATNFQFEIVNFNANEIDKINSIDTRSKIKDRLEKLNEYEFKFTDLKNENFENNLSLIDTMMPKILAYSLEYYYKGLANSCSEICDILKEKNPLNVKKAEIFYGYKFKKFLCSIALGMVPNSIWNGKDEANGGYIIVREDGEVLAYHIYNRDFFEEYLLKNTKFETASTSRYGHGALYEKNNKVFLDLNLQIRFK